MFYTVTLNPAIDYVVHLPGELRQGHVNRAGYAEAQYGGKGINVSVVLRELGMESVALGFTAGSAGIWLERMLNDIGLNTDFVRIPSGETRINVKLKAGVETDINAPGPDVPEKAMEQLKQKMLSLHEGDFLVLAGSIPLGLPTDTYEQLLIAGTAQGAYAVVDAEGALLEKVLPYHPFLIKPNREELGALFGRSLTSETEITDCAAALRGKGARNVLVSLGAEGALLYTETDEILRTPAPAGQVVNSVGAGDSMVAGFLAGWSVSGSYAEALHWGTAAGSATAFSEGIADGKTIRALLEKR